MKSLNGLIEDTQRMLSCAEGNGKGMFSIEVPGALWAQFQLLLELARLRERGADIGNFLYHDREISERAWKKNLLSSRCRWLKSAMNVSLPKAMYRKTLLSSECRELKSTMNVRVPKARFREAV